MNNYNKSIMNVIIEISKGSSVKYEFDNGKLKVDRFLNVPFVYPFNYGYLPNTLGRDDDPLDAVVICEHQLLPCVSIKCKLIGVLKTNDEHGEDNKFIFVPDDKVDIKSKNITNLGHIEKKMLDKIEYFFTHYKDLDSNKWINVGSWVGFEGEEEKLNAIYEYSNII
jgi:inorganic pyrophosphatase